MNLKNEKTVLWTTLVLFTLLTYWPIFSSGRLPGGDMSDTVAQGYPFFSYTASRLSEGELPLWNPYVLCGVPFYESFSAPVFYPLRGLPMILFGPEASIRFLFPVHMLLAGLFAWMFLKELGTGRWGSLVGAVAYSAGAWANTLFYAGHGSKVICWAWFPLVLWAVHRFIRKGGRRPLGIGALAVGMQGLSSHPQMMLYSGGSALILVLFQTRRPFLRTLARNLAGLGAVLALGGMIAAVQLYPGYLFSGSTSRGQDLPLQSASSYSMPPEETLTMFMPGAFGLRHGFSDSSVSGIPVYFGRLGLRLSSEFAGVVFFILALVGFLAGKGRRSRYMLSALALTGAIVSWGGYTPVFNFLYRLLPVFRKLRAPHMAAFVTTSAVAFSAGTGFDALFKGKASKAWKFIAGASLVSILLLVFAEPVSGAMQSSWWNGNGITDTSPYGALVSARVSLLEDDLLRIALSAGLLGLLAWLSLNGKGRIELFAASVLLVSAIELIPFNRSFQVYLPATSMDSLFPDTPALREHVGSGRVFPGSNALVPLGIRSVTGYHAAKTLETDNMLTAVSSGSPMAIWQTGMNTYLEGSSMAEWDQIQPVLAEGSESFPEDPMPRAFIPESVVPAEEDQGYSVAHLEWNPVIRTFVEGSPSSHDGVAGTAEIVLDQPENVTVETETSQPGFLVLADTWYSRWRVTVDGEEEIVYRANGWMRAVPVPEGEHTVEFTYDSGHVVTGGILSLAALISAVLLCVPFRRKGTNA